MTLVRLGSDKATKFNRNLTPSQPKSILETYQNTDFCEVVRPALLNFPSWMSRVRAPSPALLSGKGLRQQGLVVSSLGPPAKTSSPCRSVSRLPSASLLIAA